MINKNVDIQKIKSIQFSLLKKESDTKEDKTEYSKKVSAKFVIPEKFFEKKYEEDILEQLITKMYEDLMANAPKEIDSLGLWIQYDALTLDNAISLKTLDAIWEHSNKGVNPVYEFFKMTFNI